MLYGIIFWGNSSDSKKVFTLQKKIVKLMMGFESRNSCTDLVKRLETLTLPYEYIKVKFSPLQAFEALRVVRG
jgi:hypothetical protein